jgi:hypothetical protein
MAIQQSRNVNACNRLGRLPAVLLVLLTGACAHGISQDTPPLPPFESVTIVSRGPTDELKARFGVTSDNSSVGKGAGAGMGAGALAGIGLSAACGPFFLVCALGAIPTAMMVGGTGGAAVGATVDLTKKPTEEQLLVLDELFLDIAQQRTIHLEIRDALRRQVSPQRQAIGDDADAIIELSLSDVRFMQNSSGDYALKLTAIMRAQWNRNLRQMRNGKRVYQESSRSLPMDDWLQDDGRTLNLAFDGCVEGLVEQMAQDIRFKDL